jgi:rSAM/selenodomain-associated transferase 2
MTGAAAGSVPPLSVVIPTLNEAGRLENLLRDLSALETAHEVVVVDGGSTDDTVAIARTSGATVVHSPAGRGEQLRRGAGIARAPLLCFLHADTRLPWRARQVLAVIARQGQPGPRAFRLRIAAPGFSFRLVEVGANLRARWLRLPYGDQGLIVSRSDYERAGGYPPYPLMEDVALVRALNRHAPVRLLRAAIEVSARRWQRDGVLKRTVLNLHLLTRYLRGDEPARLSALYDGVERRGE